MRGNFVEFLKSKDCGQVSLFTINKNQERGGHYHNSKVEKFLIIKGNDFFIAKVNSIIALFIVPSIYFYVKTIDQLLIIMSIVATTRFLFYLNRFKRIRLYN